MPSLIPGYEYDIFISYRQKDNKYDGWVTEFVDNLKRELEATFKEEISVYFDINPHDGLLETHDVDASLKEKLKCLVFIPIISRTYCDPKSFAWEHEFRAFVEQAFQDQFGLKIKLPGGNVTSRVLPVQIHEIDTADKKLVENVLGGFLRGIEFIYKEPGVNRPLSSNEDHPDNNLNKTFYRNQINKLANSIKEIISQLRNPGREKKEILQSIPEKKSTVRKRQRTKIYAGALLLVSLIVLGYFFGPKLFKSDEPTEKSLAVLPFDNLSNNPEHEFFCIGIMHEIMNHLFKIEGLNLPSSTSTMKYKDKISQLSVREIARELGVSYVLEGNVARSDNNIRIIVRLIDGRDGMLLWTEDYNRSVTATDILEIQSDVAQQVAENLNVVINPDVRKRIESIPTKNTEAYILFQRVISLGYEFERTKTMLERVISLDPGFADAYAALAIDWAWAGGHGGSKTREEVLKNAEPLLAKALQLDKNSSLSHYAIATIRLWYYWDLKSVENEFNIIKQLGQSSYFGYDFFSEYLLASGRFTEAFKIMRDGFELNKNSPSNWIFMALAYYHNGQPDKALETLETSLRLFTEDSFVTLNSIRIYNYMGKYEEEIKLFEKSFAGEDLNKIYSYYLGHLGIAYFKTGNKSKSASFLDELISRSKNSPIGSPSFFAAAIYTSMGENDKAMQSLEKAYTDHEVELYWLKEEPIFKPLHGNPQFENLLLRMGFTQ